MTGQAVDVRRYEPDDRDAVLLLGRRLTSGIASWRDPAAAAAAVDGWARSSVDRAGTDGRAVFVAVDRGAVVGFVSVTERTHFTGEVEGYVRELAVAETGVRAGTGRALMAAAQTWASDRGLRRLSLETGAGNTAARSFYAALGYEEEEVRLSRGLPDPTAPSQHDPR